MAEQSSVIIFKRVIDFDNVDNILPIPSFQHIFIIALCFSHLVLLGKDDLALELVLFLQRSKHPVDTP